MDTSTINKNASYNIIKNICGIIFPLITFPYISRVLGPENTGKISFGLSIVSYFSLIASLGVSTYAIRECSKQMGDRNLLSRTASQIYSINIISTIIAYTLLIALLFIAKPLAAYRHLILIQSTSIIFNTLGTEWLNTAVGDFKYITYRYVIVQLLSILLLFIVVKRNSDYYLYACITVFAAGGASLSNILYRKKYCDVHFTKNMAYKNHLPSIITMFLMLVAQTVFVSMDNTIIGLFRSDTEVGLYSASTRIYMMVNTTIASLAWVLMPRMSALFLEERYSEINDLLEYALNIIIVLGMPAIVCISLLSDSIILLLAGEEYIQSVMSLRILMISLAFSLVGGFVGNIILLPSGKEFVVMISSAISAVINLVLNMLLIPRHGIDAAAATTAVANAIALIICLAFVDKRVNINGICEHAYPSVIGSAMCTVIILLIKKSLSNSLAIVLSSIIFSTLAYIALLYYLQDKFVLSYIHQVKERITRKIK